MLYKKIDAQLSGVYPVVMTIEVKPETEQLVREELESGHFRSVDELIVQSVSTWREKHKVHSERKEASKNLARFLMESPLAGSEINLERQRDYGRPI